MTKGRGRLSGADQGVGRLVRELREQAGLSIRALSRCSGLGSSTISAVEAGQEPRWSTLRLLALHLPGATARRLLHPDSLAVEPASAGLTDWLAERFGMRAREVTFTDRGPGRAWQLMVNGLSGRGRRSALILARARAACQAGAGLMLDLSAESLVGRHEADGRRHEFALEPDGSTLSYRCEGLDDAPASFRVEYPIDRLVLRVRRAGRPLGEFRVRAYRSGQEADETNEVAAYLHPTGVKVEAGRRDGLVVASIPNPPVGVGYALWTDGPGPGVRSGPERAPSSAIRMARVTAGLSGRALAREAGVPQPSIRDAEAGADVRLSTLRGVLRALPSLAPQHLLPECDAGPMDADRCWHYVTRLLGIRATELIKVVEIAHDGSRVEQVHTRRLRSLAGEARELAVRVGLRRALLQASPRVLAEIEAGDSDFTCKHVERADGADLHVFRFRRHGEEDSVSYIRRYEHAGKYTLTQAMAQRVQPQADRHRAGVALPIRIPADAGRLTIVFPSDYEPVDLRAHAWPETFLPDEALMLAHYLPSHGITRSLRGGRRAVHLAMRRPVVGMTLAISWELP